MPLVKEIETLARLRADGALSETEFIAAKQAILDEVPEAEPVRPKGSGTDVAALLARCLIPPVLVGGLVFAFGVPAMLSLTLGVTVLAAILIARFREAED